MPKEDKHRPQIKPDAIKPTEKPIHQVGWLVLEQAKQYTASILSRRRTRYGGDHNGNSHGTGGTGFRGRRIGQDGKS